MKALHEIEKLLPRMSLAEKAQVFQWIMRDIWNVFPGIEINPEVCGGEPCIVRSRIPVWVLVKARELGVLESEILRCYPTLRAEDLVSAWAYYRSHKQDIDQQIQENEDA